MKKKKPKKQRQKRGYAFMQTQAKMNDLKKRALQRHIFFPAKKDEENAKIENSFFNDVKKKLYAQITEEERWN